MTVLMKFQATRADLADSLIERDGEIDMVLTALLSREHALMIGPPGTAKSATCDILSSWADLPFFDILFNKETRLEEIFGSMDIAALKCGRYERVIGDMLPTAGIAFFDEVFKASSAILNPMLKILNERKFKNGTATLDCPLELAVAASNEWPTEAKELGALFDRFLFRKHVDPIASESNVERLMFTPDLTPSLTTTLTLDELNQARNEARMVSWSDKAKEVLSEIRRRINREGIIVGDRRLRKSVTAVQSYAWLNGNSEVTTDDLEILSHIWWVEPTEQPRVVSDIISEIAKPSRLLAATLLAEANQISRDCQVEDLEQAAVACKKLNEIAKKLDDIPGGRAAETKARVNEKMREIRIGSAASF